MPISVEYFVTRVVTVHFKAATLTVKYVIATLSCDVLPQLLERFCCATCTEKWTANDHVAFTLLNVGKPVLNHEYLVAVATLYSYLVDYIVQISILLLSYEGLLTLAALATALREPLLDASLVEDLFAVMTLNRSN